MSPGGGALTGRAQHWSLRETKGTVAGTTAAGTAPLIHVVSRAPLLHQSMFLKVGGTYQTRLRIPATLLH